MTREEVLKKIAANFGKNMLRKSEAKRYIDDFAVDDLAAKDKTYLKIALESHAFESFESGSDYDSTFKMLKDYSRFDDSLVSELIADFAKALGIKLKKMKKNELDSESQDNQPPVSSPPPTPITFPDPPKEKPRVTAVSKILSHFLSFNVFTFLFTVLICVITFPILKDRYITIPFIYPFVALFVTAIMNGGSLDTRCFGHDDDKCLLKYCDDPYVDDRGPMCRFSRYYSIRLFEINIVSISVVYTILLVCLSTLSVPVSIVVKVIVEIISLLLCLGLHFLCDFFFAEIMGRKFPYE